MYYFADYFRHSTHSEYETTVDYQIVADTWTADRGTAWDVMVAAAVVVPAVVVVVAVVDMVDRDVYNELVVLIVVAAGAAFVVVGHTDKLRIGAVAAAVAEEGENTLERGRWSQRVRQLDPNLSGSLTDNDKTKITRKKNGCYKHEKTNSLKKKGTC